MKIKLLLGPRNEELINEIKKAIEDDCLDDDDWYGDLLDKYPLSDITDAYYYLYQELSKKDIKDIKEEQEDAIEELYYDREFHVDLQYEVVKLYKKTKK